MEDKDATIAALEHEVTDLKMAVSNLQDMVGELEEVIQGLLSALDEIHGITRKHI